MIRYARSADHPTIVEVNDLAFGNPDEAQRIGRLRADREALFAALAPMSVRPGRQSAGIGSALVQRGLVSLREFGVHGVLVLGHPRYYPRLGFEAATATQVSSPYSGSPAFMALAIEPGAFNAPLSVAYPDAFSG